jgi:Ca-activated chloride channel family protein
MLLIVVCVLPIAEPAQASLWDDLWRTKDQQAQRQLEEGNAAEAAALFEDSDWRAVAHYQAEDFVEAAATFAESGDTQSLYNLGNAIARQGEFETAIDAYEQVLEMDPDDIDAAYNRDLLQQALEQQEQQQQEGEQESSEQSDGEGEQSESESESDQESEDGSKSESDSEQGDSQRDDEEASQEDLEAMQEELERAAREAEENGEKPEQMTQAELEELRRAQEQEQAMEQWLRRIPNDPGGLLRRKFRYQYQQNGRDQDGNNTWPDDQAQPW